VDSTVLFAAGLAERSYRRHAPSSETGARMIYRRPDPLVDYAVCSN
jgi:hypothetical protein